MSNPISDWTDFLPQTMTRNAFTKRNADGYGGPAYSTISASYAARVVQTPLLLTRSDGQEIVVTHTAWLGTTASIAAEDKITYAGTTYQIQEVGNFPDQSGAHHVRLRLRG